MSPYDAWMLAISTRCDSASTCAASNASAGSYSLALGSLQVSRLSSSPAAYGAPLISAGVGCVNASTQVRKCPSRRSRHARRTWAVARGRSSVQVASTRSAHSTA